MTEWHGGRTAAVAVVGGAEHSDRVLVVGPVEAVHDQLVGARYQVEAVVVVELLADVLPERVARPARRDAPPAPAQLQRQCFR